MSNQHQIIKESLQPDGGLYWLAGYLSWNAGDRKVTIDGDFTPDELRAIADHMDRVSKSAKPCMIKPDNI
jgi:hypothetical protein